MQSFQKYKKIRTWSVWWLEEFLRIFKLAFLLYLAPAEVLTLRGQFSNPAGQSYSYTQPIKSYCENTKKNVTPLNRPGQKMLKKKSLPMDIIWFFIWQGNINNIRNSLDINTSGGHIGTDQKFYLNNIEK